MIEIPTLYTKRLTLRAPRWSDFEAYANYRGSDRVKLLGGPFTRAQAFNQLAEILGHWVLRGYGRWMVADRETDAPMGIVGCYYPEDWPEPEIAWGVFENAEGKGIAFEAASEARRFAYEVLGWDTAISLIAAENTRSLALAERMGATFEKNYEHDTYGIMPVYRHPSPEEVL
ncbi:MAG: GNAT family N-acetyltransferase [Pseudomonadota bacterium]